jgi:hypothetical protein
MTAEGSELEWVQAEGGQVIEIGDDPPPAEEAREEAPRSLCSRGKGETRFGEPPSGAGLLVRSSVLLVSH